jgi:predicted nucleic acid-binding protein
LKGAVVADAGPLYAAVDPSDRHHQQALIEAEEITRSRVGIVISYSTVLEVYTLLMRKLGRSVALRWLGEISSAALVNPTLDDYRQASTKLAAFADQPITLFDATVAILATRMGLSVWTYDHHFDIMQIQVWR